MFGNLEILRLAGALASYASGRQGVIAENVANADTPGYRARDLPDFAALYADGSGGAMLATRSGHLGAQGAALSEAAPVLRTGGGAMSPNGNGVSVESEMMNAAEVRQQHDLALSVYGSSLGILRSALGRAA